MTDSNDIRDEFSPLLDDELSPDARDAVERELAQDSEALRELDAFRKIDHLYRGLARANAPNDLAERVRDEVSGKSNVTVLKPRRIPIALYSGLAAAAVFMVVIGGLVVRQDFVVSPAPSELAATALEAETLEKSEVESDALQQQSEPQPATERANAFGDDAVPSDEGNAPMRQRVRDEREASSEATRRAETQRAQEAAVPALRGAQAEAPAGRGRASAAESKDQAASMAEAGAPEPPPPPPAPLAAAPVPEETPAGDRADEEAAQELADMQQADVDADAASPESETRAQIGVARKRSADIKEIAGRVFMKREDGWYERGYDGEPTQIVRRESDGLEGFAQRVEKLDELLKLEGAVVFRLDERWYRIPAKDAENP